MTTPYHAKYFAHDTSFHFAGRSRGDIRAVPYDLVVVETNYCITLDRVPEELYPEIAANDAQREEWVRIFAIDKIEKDLNGPGYSEPLTIDFLSRRHMFDVQDV